MIQRWPPGTNGDAEDAGIARIIEEPAWGTDWTLGSHYFSDKSISEKCLALGSQCYLNYA
jgi:hypothetical protein